MELFSVELLLLILNAYINKIGLKTETQFYLNLNKLKKKLKQLYFLKKLLNSNMKFYVNDMKFT